MIPSATETRCPSAITYAGASRNFDNDDNGQSFPLKQHSTVITYAGRLPASRKPRRR
ncbi:hypothetical protein M3J09_006069 [Ascochyta lentis]